MGKLKAQKVMSIETSGFTETIEFEVLNQSNVGVNHNKFYCLELQHNPTDLDKIISEILAKDSE